jgi:hypothetical protein
MDDSDDNSSSPQGGSDGSTAAQTDTSGNQSSTARSDSSTSATLADDGSGGSTSNQMDGGASSTTAQTDTGATQSSGGRSDSSTTATLGDGGSGGATGASQADPATQAQFLAAAGQDADLKAGSGQVGDPVAGCGDEPSSAPDGSARESVSTQGVLGDGQPAAGSLPGALEVTVLNALDDSPIAGATVTVQGPFQTVSGTTDASTGASRGTVTFDPLIPDFKYVVVARNGSGFTQEMTVAYVPSGSESNPVKKTLKLTPVTVTLTLGLFTVACPGHPFQLDAKGTPADGDYTWSISGDGQLRDSGGASPLTTGDRAFLVGYLPDNVNGKIPPKSATVSVTYSVRGGSASASQQVPIHGIDFVVTGNHVDGSIICAKEIDSGVNIGDDGLSNEILIAPFVQIKLGSPDASNACPRKDECAKNHRVGWLQTVTSWDAQGRYKDKVDPVPLPTPIRDGLPKKQDTKPPFALPNTVKIFLHDGDRQAAIHVDSPGAAWAWEEPFLVFFSTELIHASFSASFTSWLVVQNIEWSSHDRDGSFVFLGNFDWSVALDFDVDTTQPVGKKCSKHLAPVNVPVPPAFGTGKGSKSPVLGDPTADELLPHES